MEVISLPAIAEDSPLGRKGEAWEEDIILVYLKNVRSR